MHHERCLTRADTTNLASLGHRSVAGAPTREYFHYVPANVRRDSPVVVSVHGISMNAAEHLFRLMPEAARRGAVLVAPLFRREVYGKYQLLEDPRSGTRADAALLDILADVEHLAGVDAARVHLTGFSGGAQFAHRFAIYHAGRVATCVPCAAGWYSFPDAETPYPLGLAARNAPEGMQPHPDWLRTPVHVIVGAQDRARDDSLNQSAPITALQGRHRLQRARRWVRALRERQRGHGERAISLTELADVGHDFTRAIHHGGLAGLIFDRCGLPRTDHHA